MHAWHTRRGAAQSTTEYAILLSLVALVTWAVCYVVGQRVRDTNITVSNAMSVATSDGAQVEQAAPGATLFGSSGPSDQPPAGPVMHGSGPPTWPTDDGLQTTTPHDDAGDAKGAGQNGHPAQSQSDKSGGSDKSDGSDKSGGSDKSAGQDR